MQNHMAEDVEKLEVETPRIWRHSSRRTLSCLECRNGDPLWEGRVHVEI